MHKKLNLPINVSELDEFLPHRGPMVWVRQISHVNSEGGEGLVHLDPQAHYMDHEKVRRSSAIEWIAQTYGFVSACQRLAFGNGVPERISRTYLVSFKNVSFFENFDLLIQAEKSLAVSVRTLRDLKPLKTIYGEVKTLTGTKIAAGEVTVYSEFQ